MAHTKKRTHRKQPTQQIQDYDTEQAEREQLLGGGSTLSRGEDTNEEGERQEDHQRDLEPDEFDESTNVDDDRIRGAGGQSLDDLVMRRGLGQGLEEHAGGLRFDRPESNVNDRDPTEEMDDEAKGA
jgi:hypothetical protein